MESKPRCPKCNRPLRVCYSDSTLLACVTCDATYPKPAPVPFVDVQHETCAADGQTLTLSRVVRVF